MKTTLQQQRDLYSDFMHEDTCPEQEEVSKEKLDEAISDCQIMLQYSIDRGDKEEVSYWRKLLQENKVLRRLFTT